MRGASTTTSRGYCAGLAAMTDRRPDAFRRSTIHQCLFGYDRGHRLLVSSTDLPSPVARALLVASDLPVQDSSDPDNPTLTAFPVDEHGVYALSCTWAAPEMPRPGCVWTHTILVPFPILARIPDLGVLRSAFRRPDRAGTFDVYADDIVDTALEAPVSRASIHTAETKATLAALYREPGHRVIVEADPDSDFEGWIAFAFAVWSQQWPRLRRSFRFSTRDVGARRNVADCDLQLFRPEHSARSTRTGGEGPRVAGRAAPSNPRASLPDDPQGRTWIDVAFLDLGQPRSILKSFLKRYGADASAGRGAFEGLVAAYCALTTRDLEMSSRRFGAAIRESFVALPEAAALKADVVSGRIQFHAGAELSRFEWLARMLDEVGEPGATFDRDKIAASLRESFNRLPFEQRFEMARDGLPFGEFGWIDDALSGLVGQADVADVLHFAQGDKVLLRHLARIHPEFLLDRAVMRSDAGRELLKAALANEELDLDRLFDAICFVEDDDRVELAFALDRERATDRVLDALDEGIEIPRPWLTCAFDREGLLLDQFIRRKGAKLSTFLLILDRLGVRNGYLRAIGTSTWSNVIGGLRNDLSEAGHVRAAAYVFAMAMDRPGKGAEDLFARSFDPLHAAAAKDALGSSWWIVEPFLPGKYNYWSWDKCRRLRAGVCETYLHHRLDGSKFISTTRSFKTFKLLLDESYPKYGGPSLLAQALNVNKAPTNRLAKMKRAIERIVRADY